MRSASLVVGLVAVAVVVVNPFPAQAQAPQPEPQQQPAPPAPAPQGPPSVVGRVLALDEAIAIALENQPTILASLYAYAAARYQVAIAFAPLLPQLTGNVSATKSKNPALVTSTTGGAVVQVQNNRDFSQTVTGLVTMTQLLWDFGKTAAATDAAKKNAQVSLENVELQRQLITDAVKEAFTNVNFAGRLIQVQRQALERAELNLKSARGFFEVGTRPKSDVTRAEVDVANGRVAVIQAVNAQRTARVALNTAMGLAANTPTEIQDNLVYTPSNIDRPRLLEEALRQRPEYRQAKLKVEAAEAVERQAGRGFLPNITGTGSYGGTQQALREEWTATLNLSWTLFDGGNLIAVYQQAKANTEAARATVRTTELQISQDVQQAEIAVSEAEERIQAAQKAVESAQENFRLAQGRFDAGVGTILELTDAQLALTQAQNTEAQALSDFRIGLAKLDRALGRR